MPSKFATDLQNAIYADDSEQIEQLHRDNPNEGLDANHQSITFINDTTPLNYAVQQKKLNSITSLLSLGYQVSEPNRCDAVQILFNEFHVHVSRLHSDHKEIVYLLMAHPTYRPTYRPHDFVGLQLVIDYTFESAHTFSLEHPSVLLTFRIFTSHNPFELDHKIFLSGKSGLPLALMGNIVFGKNRLFRILSSADANRIAEISSGEKLAAFLIKHNQVSPSLKQKILDAGKNVPLHLFAEMIPLEKQFHLAKLLYVDPTPEISEIICTLLTTRSYLNNPEDCILLKQCCASLKSIDGIKRCLKEYSDYAVLDDPRVWPLLDQYLPQGLPKHLDVSKPESINLFKFAKAWMAGSTQTTELISAITEPNSFDATVVQTFYELLFHVVNTLISNEKSPEKTNTAYQLLKAFAQKLGGDIEWLVYKTLESGLINGSSYFKKQSTVLEESRERCKKDSGLIDNSDLESIFPLINYVLSNDRQPVIRGPKKQAVHRTKTKSFSIQFLQWFENYILLNLQKEFGFARSLVANVYPEFEETKESIVAAQNEFAYLGKNDGLFYDPLAVPVQAVLLHQNEDAEPKITYPDVEEALPSSAVVIEKFADITHFESAIHAAIFIDDGRKIKEIFASDPEKTEEYKEKIKASPLYSPLLPAVAHNKPSAIKELFAAGFRVSENTVSLITILATQYTHFTFGDTLLKILRHPTYLSSKSEVEKCGTSLSRISFENIFGIGLTNPKMILYQQDFYALIIFKFLLTPQITDFPKNLENALTIFNPICFDPTKWAHSSSRPGLVSLLLASGLIPEDFKKNLLNHNAIHNIPLHAFAPLIPRENIFHWIKLVFKDPTDELIRLMKPLLISKLYLHNASDRTFLQNCCNHLRSVEKLIPLLTDYSDFCVLDHRAIWIPLYKRLPIGMPAHLDFSKDFLLHFFIFAKWWMAENGPYLHTTLRISDLSRVIQENYNAEKLQQIEIELLLYIIMDIRKYNKDTPENNAKAQAAKELLHCYAKLIPEVYWIMARLYESNCLRSSTSFKTQKKYSEEKMKLFEDHSKYGSTKLEDYFPLVNYVLLKRTGPIHAVKLKMSIKNAPLGIQFLDAFENFILKNLKPIFGIDIRVIETVYPNAKNIMDKLIVEEENKNLLEFDREDGLFYKLPEVAFDRVQVVVKLAPPTAPPMSVMPSRDSSPSRSRSNSVSTADEHAIVADDLIEKLKQIPPSEERVDDDNPVEDLNEAVAPDATDVERLEKMSAENAPLVDPFPAVATHDLAEAKPQCIAIAEGVLEQSAPRLPKEKNVAKAMPFFAAPIESDDNDPVDEYIDEIEQFSTTSEKLNFVNAAFKLEAKNLHHCVQISAHETNELMQQILNRINALAAWKHLLSFRLKKEREIENVNMFSY